MAIFTEREELVAHVALPDHDLVCGGLHCESPSDLVITFTGTIAPPHYQCFTHWPAMRSLLADAGYTFEYSPDALTLLEATQ